MRYVSVCSGIESASHAWELLDWEAAAFAEIDPFASAVLAFWYPWVRNLGDFTRIDASSLGHVDLLVGGTPCQDFSSAGKRAGLKGEHGRLTLAFTDLIDALEESCGLRYVVWENVPEVLCLAGNPFGQFLGRLLRADGAVPCPTGNGRWPRAGMATGPTRSVAWRVLDAQFFGTPQRRERLFLVVGLGALAANPGDILFEPASGLHPGQQTRERRRRDLVQRYLRSPADYVDDWAGHLGPVDRKGFSRPPAWAFNADGRVSHVAYTVLASDGPKTDVGVVQDGFPRRYLAIERERLQGFMDGYTDIYFKGRVATHEERTRALGNAMPVTVMNWLGRRIEAADALLDGRSTSLSAEGTPRPGRLDEAALTTLDFLMPRRMHRLLYAMLIKPEQEFILADLFRVSGLGRGATQGLVERLIKTGLVVERRTSNRRYLKADMSHPLAPELRSLLLKARSAPSMAVVTERRLRSLAA